MEKGDKLRAFYQLDQLNKCHEVHLITLCEKDIDPEHLDIVQGKCHAQYLFYLKPIQRYISILRAILSSLPFETAWFYHPDISKEIQTIINNIKPDHIFCQLTRMAEYVKLMEYKKTLDYMDCFSIGMERRAHVASWWLSYLYKTEAKRMKHYETNIATYFDHHLIISEQDKNQLPLKSKAKLHVIPNGIHESYLEYSNHTKQKYSLVFVGNLGYLPNIEAVRVLVRDILKKLPNHFTLLLGGANPNKEIENYGSSRIHITGWVEDIKEVYHNGKIFVAPIWSGTGQQNKILEAMALGVPCITTTSVNNAIKAIDGTHILIANTIDEFVEQIKRLDQDHVLYTTLVKNAREFVKVHYNWEQIGTQMSSILDLKI